MPLRKEIKALILLSSGLDFSVNFILAQKETSLMMALTFDYGQMAAEKEIKASQKLCAKYGISHRVVDVGWFSDFSKSALNAKQSLPVSEDVSIDDKQQSKKSAEKVWVPNRNGIFLNIAAGYMEGLGGGLVIPGFNVEEAASFPDNSDDFLKALSHSFEYSTEGRVKAHCFTTLMNKTEIVAQALRNRLDLSKLWPCYQNFKKWCGQCESCLRFKRAVEGNGLSFESLQNQSGSNHEG